MFTRHEFSTKLILLFTILQKVITTKVLIFNLSYITQLNTSLIFDVIFFIYRNILNLRNFFFNLKKVGFIICNDIFVKKTN